MDLATVTAAGWLLLALGAVLVGFSKTAIGGFAMLSVAMYAAVLPARESTAALLLLLLVGDVVAVRVYRQHAQWSTLLRLAPAVAVGVVAGAAFLYFASNDQVQRTIGAIILVLVAVHVWRRWHTRHVSQVAVPHRLTTYGAGTLAGYTSMVANAGGAVMSVYLLGARLSVLEFLGTSAWFFLGVNLFKLPFTAALGLISQDTLILLVAMAPLVLLGTFIGRRVINRINRDQFEVIVLALTTLGGINLLR